MDYKKNPHWITYPDLQSVEGKTVLVTGGTTGIGRATMLLLASRGARVMVFGRHRKELDDALQAAHAIEGEVYGLTADQADPSDVQRVFEELDSQLGRLDILVNNAAVAAGSVLEGSISDWRYALHANLLGYVHCSRLAVDRMREQEGGHIVNIGSMSADLRQAGSDIYAATKAAIQGFSESLRKQVNPMGIKVSLIEPGRVGSDLFEGRDPDEQRRMEDSQEMLKAEDVAECVYYCLIQPPRCDVVEMRIRPHMEPI